jgi:hypothetical protein
MNAHTLASLAARRTYCDETLATIEAGLADPVTLSDEQWKEYFNRLDATFGDGYACAMDKSKSEAILSEMVGPDETVRALRVVTLFGGHCDCEVLLNAVRDILPDPIMTAILSGRLTRSMLAFGRQHLPQTTR